MRIAFVHFVLLLVSVGAGSNKKSYVDSPALPGQGFRKQFLSVRHHLCSHHFFQMESRARTSTFSVFPFIKNGIDMELGVLAATTSIDKAVDAVAVTRFEALIFASKRNFSKSNQDFYSHCMSESCQFTELTCIVNGQASRATVYESTRDIPSLQSVLKCDINADASTDLVVTLSSPSDSLQVNLNLCALNRSSILKVVGCAQPWMDAHSLERRYPGVHRAYILYHLKYVGLDHISIFDNDGSVAEFLKDTLKHPKVSYFPKWGASEAMAREAGASRSHYACTETYAENQCIWNARGVSEWALLMHNIDNWVGSDSGYFRTELDSTPLSISTLLIHQYTMGSACPKPASFSHALMIFDRNSPLSWRHCPRYCMERPVVDPHMVYSTFVHLPLPYEFSIPTTMVASTLVFHFEQLYHHRALTSGSCGAPAIVENPNDCYFNFCFQDLSHIQSFLMAEFNVSTPDVAAMSKELSVLQERISAAAVRGGFNAADEVASIQFSSAVQDSITLPSGNLTGTVERESVVHNETSIVFHLPERLKFISPSNHTSFYFENFFHLDLFCLSAASIVLLIFFSYRSFQRRFTFKASAQSKIIEQL